MKTEFSPKKKIVDSIFQTVSREHEVALELVGKAFHYSKYMAEEKPIDENKEKKVLVRKIKKNRSKI